MNIGGKIFVSIVGVVSLLVIYNVYQSQQQQRRYLAAQRAVVEQRKALEQQAAEEAAVYARQFEWQQKLLQTTDYAPFVREATPVAEAGNVDAQFALFAAYSYCYTASREPGTGEPDAHARCDALAAEHSDIGNAALLWLDRAVQAQYPYALVADARKKLSRLDDLRIARGERDRRRAQAREQLLQALRTDDALITWQVADLLPVLFPKERRAERARWVWKLAACEQGMSCREPAKSVNGLCGADSGCHPNETGEEFIRRKSGDLPQLYVKARGIVGLIRVAGMDDAELERSVMTLDAPPLTIAEAEAARRKHAEGAAN